MSKANNKKPILVQDHEHGETKKQTQSDRKEIKQLILNLTEGKVDVQFSDKYFDRQREKINLLSGVSVSIMEIEKIVAKTINWCEPKFKKEFYQEICRLKNWSLSLADEFFKRKEFADFTNELIYGRFKEGILSVIQIKNPYVCFTLRKYKHYHLMTNDGQAQVDQFIKEAIVTMKECNTWYEFRKLMYSKYDVPYQINLHEN